MKLYVEPQPGTHIDPGMIRDVCEMQLPSGLIPGEIEIRPSLPLTPAGEVLRRLLRDVRPARATTTKDIS